MLLVKNEIYVLYRVINLSANLDLIIRLNVISQVTWYSGKLSVYLQRIPRTKLISSCVAPHSSN